MINYTKSLLFIVLLAVCYSCSEGTEPMPQPTTTPLLRVISGEDNRYLNLGRLFVVVSDKNNTPISYVEVQNNMDSILVVENSIDAKNFVVHRVFESFDQTFVQIESNYSYPFDSINMDWPGGNREVSPMYVDVSYNVGNMGPDGTYFIHGGSDFQEYNPLAIPKTRFGFDDYLSTLFFYRIGSSEPDGYYFNPNFDGTVGTFDLESNLRPIEELYITDQPIPEGYTVTSMDYNAELSDGVNGPRNDFYTFWHRESVTDQLRTVAIAGHPEIRDYTTRISYYPNTISDFASYTTITKSGNNTPLFPAFSTADFSLNNPSPGQLSLSTSEDFEWFTFRYGKRTDASEFVWSGVIVALNSDYSTFPVMPAALNLKYQTMEDLLAPPSPSNSNYPNFGVSVSMQVKDGNTEHLVSRYKNIP